MSVLVLDAGNSIIKAKISRRDTNELSFPHVIKPLSETEFEKITARANITSVSTDYFWVNRVCTLAGGMVAVLLF